MHIIQFEYLYKHICTYNMWTYAENTYLDTYSNTCPVRPIEERIDEKLAESSRVGGYSAWRRSGSSNSPSLSRPLPSPIRVATGTVCTWIRCAWRKNWCFNLIIMMMMMMMMIMMILSSIKMNYNEKCHKSAKA
jgi:hypothetical protein